ncbi:uncharacterized protein LOC136037675 [Artemia franciscana]|uniref:CUB domain-containing protein n=1 Tax=Artemia franciscana TaxID=6661 RepID=A0AA88I000_ARTSF|nr:hypothetical protein QYM36_005990 [Artemia franciscana]
MMYYIIFLFLVLVHSNPIFRDYEGSGSPVPPVIDISELFDNGPGEHFTTSTDIDLYKGYWSWQPESETIEVRQGVLTAQKRFSEPSGDAHLHTVMDYDFTTVSYVTAEINGFKQGSPSLFVSYVDEEGNHADPGFEQEVVFPISEMWLRGKATVIATNLDQSYGKICVQGRNITQENRITIDSIVVYDSSIVPTEPPKPTEPTTTLEPIATNCIFMEVAANTWVWDTPNYPDLYPESRCTHEIKGTAITRIGFSIIQGCSIPDPETADCSNAYVTISDNERLCGNDLSGEYSVSGDTATLEFRGDKDNPGQCQINIVGYFD